ncbi:hypothetical protein J7T55_000129 [Diaporthe amygdali]|uniref:uncharacterized protein n=1 Tax=Phomopsis amygdali TaxID=1214568 RepID=UPI0022FF2B59|nr:uncharacterized protein J7T55_000129 [Diaporthe amygdali]KAJ0108164.1 hypothetical protein J7T55_000129 [Diaporthe amygdali]
MLPKFQTFKQRRRDNTRPNDLRSLVTRFLHVSVLWLLFAIFVGASTGTFAASWFVQSDGGNRLDNDFYNLLSQAFLTLLASYCTLLPVLHDALTRERSRVQLPVPTAVFYLSVIATICTAVAAPVTYAKVREDSNRANIGNTMNFVSSFFAVVTASQLAGGIMRIREY